jgi:hypothetical protein
LDSHLPIEGIQVQDLTLVLKAEAGVHHHFGALGLHLKVEIGEIRGVYHERKAFGGPSAAACTFEWTLDKG